MPNLVGIGNSQVPTNAMLGGLAYQDSVGEINIDKIKAKTSDTAKDIFVYDTSKDSDGGAWRHRTQNKSWYNEGVSATRGTRKEFPVVAIIVITDNSTGALTIYDGDDPNMPIWMRFDEGAGFSLWSSTNRSSVTALNGIIAVGQNTTVSLAIIEFVRDEIYNRRADTNKYNVQKIIHRNTNTSPVSQTFTSYYAEGLVNTSVNDVSMTVTPNTPTDTSTGLPNPTIAVATNGGISIINSTGTIFDLTTNNEASGVAGIAFLSDNRYSFSTNANNSRWWVDDIQTSDENHNYFYQRTTYDYVSGGTQSLNALGTTNGTSRGEDGEAIFRQASGVSRVRYLDRLINHIASDYNTGWMYSDIKGAFLSDTSTTNVTGEKIDLTNGSETAGQWGSPSANQIAALSTSDAIGRYDTGTDGSVLVVGKQYLATLTISNYSGSGDLGVAGGAGFDSSFRYSANGVYTTYITYTSGEVQLFYRNTNQATIRISLREVVVDRSHKNKGLAIHGTITKEPVATGAELVAYSGFSDSNYLKQPYSSDLDFGTGDLYIMFWAKFSQNNAYDDLIHRRAHNGSAYTGNGWYLQMGSNNNIVLKDSATGASRAVMDGDTTYDAWQHFCFVRRDNVGYSYKNGIQGSATTPAWNENLDNTSAVLTIGRSTISGGGDSDKTSFALVRIGAGAPSVENIKKIYNDEKCLYHENAKCTLYGTSDTPTALGFDDSTDTLHVGTSSGRSDFRGLNRINNTTTAVTTAISASNGLVAEQ